MSGIWPRTSRAPACTRMWRATSRTRRSRRSRSSPWSGGCRRSTSAGCAWTAGCPHSGSAPCGGSRARKHGRRGSRASPLRRCGASPAAGAVGSKRVGARGWNPVDAADVAALIVSSPKAADVPDDAPDATDAELAREYRTIAELAREYRVSEEHVRRMCVDGRLPAVRVGAVWRIPRQEAQAVVTKACVRAGHEADACEAEAGQAAFLRRRGPRFPPGPGDCVAVTAFVYVLLDVDGRPRLRRAQQGSGCACGGSLEAARECPGMRGNPAFCEWLCSLHARPRYRVIARVAYADRYKQEHFYTERLAKGGRGSPEHQLGRSLVR